MKITCPECSHDEFERDLFDNQIYTCKKCNAEIKVLSSVAGFLTKDEIGKITEHDY